MDLSVERICETYSLYSTQFFTAPHTHTLFSSHVYSQCKFNNILLLQVIAFVEGQNNNPGVICLRKALEVQWLECLSRKTYRIDPRHTCLHFIKATLCSAWIKLTNEQATKLVLCCNCCSKAKNTVSLLNWKVLIRRQRFRGKGLWHIKHYHTPISRM